MQIVANTAISEKHFIGHYKWASEQHQQCQIRTSKKEWMKGIPRGLQMGKIHKASSCESSWGLEGDVNRALGINLMGQFDTALEEKQQI